MTNILFGTVRNCSSLFKRNYLKKEKLILNFTFLFWNLHQVLNIFKKEKIVIGNVFSKLETLKDLVIEHSLKSAVSELPLRVNMLKGPKLV